MNRHALVFGANGFIGRHLVLALGQAGVEVSTANRSVESYRRLTSWLAERGQRQAPADLRVDFTAPSLLAGDATEFTEIYNCAGAYRFGMSADEAREANVDSVRAIVDFAAKLARLRRLVHVSGYRVGGAELKPGAYQVLGAYEASKVEADALFRESAERLDVPWTVVNPAVVIGDSSTGESDQLLGLATNVREVWQGTLQALPGNAKTFVPVVPVDFFARFMIALPEDEATNRASYWVLDDDTPALPDLLTQVAKHYEVPAPRLKIPVALIKRLPAWLTRTEPETLSFLATDRYPTGPANAVAARHGLTMPDGVIPRWADYLAAHRFGEAPDGIRVFTEVAGVRTFVVGEPSSPTVVLPGLPVNADTWAPVAEALSQARVVDLPGLGMSGGGPDDWAGWLSTLVTETGARHLVGHSIAAAAALEVATAHPDIVDTLTLVSPFFLQPRAGFAVRLAPLTRRYLSRVRPEALAARLTGDPGNAAALRSSVADLRRLHVAATVARLLARTRSERWRTELRAKLADYPGQVHVIVGADDPLADELPHGSVTVIPGAGHHPQLTHPQDVAQAIKER